MNILGVIGTIIGIIFVALFFVFIYALAKVSGDASHAEEIREAQRHALAQRQNNINED